MDINELPIRVNFTQSIKKYTSLGERPASHAQVLRALLFTSFSNPGVVSDIESAKSLYAFICSLACQSPVLLFFETDLRQAEYQGLLSCREGRKYSVELAEDHRIVILPLDAPFGMDCCHASSLVLRAILGEVSILARNDGLEREILEGPASKTEWIVSGVKDLCLMLNFHLPGKDNSQKCKIWETVCRHISGSKVITSLPYRIAHFLRMKMRPDGDSIILEYVQRGMTRGCLDGTPYERYEEVLYFTPKRSCALYIATLHLLL